MYGFQIILHFQSDILILVLFQVTQGKSKNRHCISLDCKKGKILSSIDDSRKNCAARFI